MRKSYYVHNPSLKPPGTWASCPKFLQSLLFLSLDDEQVSEGESGKLAECLTQRRELNDADSSDQLSHGRTANSPEEATVMQTPAEQKFQ